jgi:diguanylate cyclase (GGDEF)-like protein
VRLRPTTQLAAALVLLTSLILLGVDLVLDVFPAPEQRVAQQRKAFAETLATQATVALQRGDHKGLSLTFDRLRALDSTIRSLAVRRADGGLLVQSGDHKAAWQQGLGERSTLVQLFVPLSSGATRWGSVEVAYFPDERSALQRALLHPLWVTLLAVALLGGLVYWIYLRRALVHLDPTAVIPERVKLAFDVMTEAVAVLDRSGRVLLANRAFRALPDDADVDPVGRPLSELPWLAGGLPADSAEHPWHQAMRGAAPVSGLPMRVEATRKHLVVNCAPIADARGKVRGCIATFDDLTALHIANERLSAALAELRVSRDEIQQKNVELEHVAAHDTLTGCLTRGAFFDRIARAREQAQRDGSALSCLALDIDRFKSVNDRFGHGVGDRVIQAVGAALLASLRTSDIVGRYGGDEFFAGMPGCSASEAHAIAEKVRRAVETRCNATLSDVAGLKVTVSIGVAVLGANHATLASLIEDADRALYAAKSAGRNRVAGAAAPA